MKARSVMIHGVWAALAVGAFLIGRLPEKGTSQLIATEGGEPSGSTPSLQTIPGQTLWISGPGDSPDEFSLELASVLAEEDEEVRSARFAKLMGELTPAVLDGLTEEMVAGVLQLFELPGSFDITWHRQKPFFRAWARLNPQAAFAYVTDPEKPGRATSYGQGAVIEEWAKIDMESAQEALAGLESATTRHNMGIDLMNVLLESDLDAAIAYSAKLQREENSTSGIYGLVRKLREERGIAGVQRWLDSTDAYELGEGAIAYKKEALEWFGYRSEPSEITDLLARNADRPFVDSGLVLDLAFDVSRKAQDRASVELDWIASLPNGIGAKGEALGARFEKYMKSDFEGAGAWLAGQDLGRGHDEAIEIFVRNATMDDVPAAMLWAELISDSGLRAETIRFVRNRGG